MCGLPIRLAYSLPEEHADYVRGVQARIDKRPFDPKRSKRWQNGWHNMDEKLKAQPDYALLAS